MLQENFDPLEKEWAEEEFQEYKVLLYVNETKESEEIEGLLLEKLDDISLLRREEM